MASSCLKTLARSIFLVGVESVSPRAVVDQALRRVSDSLVIDSGGEHYEFPLRKNVKIVGFGKAVHSMALGAVDIVGNHLQQPALCSVPEGITRSNQQRLEDRIVLYHGARHNLPDASAAHAASEIYQLAKSCDANDVLIVLISGGGSALLPMPVQGISLDEKCQTTQLLAKAGADIVQLNTIRHHLSQLKAGGLARIAQPAKVVSLILSDVLGDRLDIIAGGPTCSTDTTRKDCLQICSSLGVLAKLPTPVQHYLSLPVTGESGGEFPTENVTNVIVGGNGIAVTAALAEASKHVDTTFSYNGLEGDADELGCFYGRWMHLACDAYNGCSSSLRDLYEWIMSRLDDEALAMGVVEACQQRRSFCFVAGAEPTVSVRGSGVGGRSQQLALRAAVEMAAQRSQLHRGEKRQVGSGGMVPVFLAAGTDGIDGPTDACGAMAHADSIGTSMKEAASCLVDNDAYNFYRKFGNQDDLLITGPTGTNVADLHILLFQDQRSAL